MLVRKSKGLEKLFQNKSWILADGDTGTNLFNLGLSSGDAPELWNKATNSKIKALYRGSVDAGSDLFLTNSFGANRLDLNCTEQRTMQLNFHVSQLKLAGELLMRTTVQ